MLIDLATINMGPGGGTSKPEMSFLVTPSTEAQEIIPDEGYVFSSGTVEAVDSNIDPNILSNNIISGVSILGVMGTAVVPSGTVSLSLSVDPGEAVSYGDDVTAYEYITLSVYGPSVSTFDVTPSTVAQSVTAPSGKCFVSGTVQAVTAAIDSNIFPGNIRSGVEILGVSGTYGGGGIEPTGTLSISSNGVYDCSVYASVDVSIAGSPYRYMKGKINGLSNLDWDAESISYAQDNIDFYTTDASVYDVNQDDLRITWNLDEYNITGNTGVRYAPMFTPEKTDWGQEFQGCTKLITIPLYDTEGVQYFGPMSHSGYNGCFAGCSNLKTIPAIDTSSARDMYCMFVNCSSLETVPLMDTSNVVNFAGMFRGCKSLKSVPKFDFSSAQTLTNMFWKCTSLKTVPQFDLSNVENLNNLFVGCESLEYVPALDTSNAIYMNYAFSWVIESTRNADTTTAPTGANTATNYGLIHKLDNLKRVDGWDFSSLSSAPLNFFGAYNSNATVITPKSLPNLTHFIVNGSINFTWDTVGQGWWMTPYLDFESIKSILGAMNRNDGTDMEVKSMKFNETIQDDANGTLQSLYDACIDPDYPIGGDPNNTVQRWSINGLTIIPYGE